jgi:recombination protein RecA
MTITPDKLLTGLRKQFGEEARISMASDLKESRNFQSSGSLALDFALGNGGWPTNRVVEICGGEHIGKTSLALLTMRSFLLAQPERYALFLDLEHKSDGEWVSSMVGPELMGRVIIIQPLHIEQATDMYVSAVGGNPKEGIPAGSISIAVLDSIGGAPTIRTTQKSAEIANYGGNAIGVGNFARLAASHSNIHNTLTIGINQVREDMAGLHQTIRPGGKAWKHAIVQSVVLKKGQGKVFTKLNGEDIPVGQEVKAKVIKNGCAIPHRTANYWFFNTPSPGHPFGIDTMEEIVRLATITEVISRKGGWYHHPALDGGRVLGKDKLQDVIRDDRALYATLRSEVMARLGDHADQVAPIEPEEDEGEQRTTYGNILKDDEGDE